MVYVEYGSTSGFCSLRTILQSFKNVRVIYIQLCTPSASPPWVGMP